MSDGRAPDNPREGGARDSNGRFLPGWKPGRKHRIDLLSTCDRMAREEGTTLEAMLWQQVKALHVAAVMGDVAAAKILFDHLVAQPRHVEYQVGVDLTMHAGPPAPRTPEDVAAYLDELAALRKDLLEPRLRQITVERVVEGEDMFEP